MSFYSFIKEKQKKEYDLGAYEELLTEILISMFDYKKHIKVFYERTLETALRVGGYAMTTKDDNGEFVTCPCHPTGLPNDNGEWVEFIGYTRTGKTFNRTKYVDCVIWQNNSVAHGEKQVDKYSELLTEVDASLRNNIRFSRLLPIPLAKNNTMVEQIKECQTALENGQLKVIMDANMIEDDLTNGDPIKVVQLSDVNFSDKLQNLTYLWNDIITRFATQYGHNLKNSPKKAQQSIEEINGNESYSHIIPMDNYKWRKKAIDEINEMYGTDIEIDFSPTWKAQLVEFLETCDGKSIEEHVEEQEDPENVGTENKEPKDQEGGNEDEKN